jgi:hypothetical protein
MEVFAFTVFPILFIGMGCAVCFGLARLGGWHSLASRYGTISTPAFCETFRMQSGRVGIVDYSSSLTIRVSDLGIHLSVMPPFSLGHSPLLIPWSDISSQEPKKLLWRELISFNVGHPPIATITLPKKILEAGRQWIEA